MYLCTNDNLTIVTIFLLPQTTFFNTHNFCKIVLQKQTEGKTIY